MGDESDLSIMRACVLLVAILLALTALARAGELECGLCVVVVNELEGMATANVSQSELTTLLRQGCAKLANESETLTEACDLIVDALPLLFKAMDNKANVTEVCTDYLGLCSVDIPYRQDPSAMPGSPSDPYILNLDAPAEQRWTALCSQQQYRDVIQRMVNVTTAAAPNVMAALADSGELLLDALPSDFATEIRSCASGLGIDAGLVSVLNLGYEISDFCTSIVIQTTDNQIFHGRNLDFGAGLAFTDDLRNLTTRVIWQQNNNTLFESIQFVGFVGVLTGMRPGSFSGSINTRWLDQPPWDIWQNIVDAIKNGNTSPPWLLRQTLSTATSYTDAVSALSTQPLDSNVYFTVGGTQAGEGVVLARNRSQAVYQWPIDTSSGRWFQLIANYDQTEPQPWYDNRYTAAEDALLAAGQPSSSDAFDLLRSVLSTKPVLNRMTTQTDWMQASSGTLEGERRYCNAPCSF